MARTSLPLLIRGPAVNQAIIARDGKMEISVGVRPVLSMGVIEHMTPNKISRRAFARSTAAGAAILNAIASSSYRVLAATPRGAQDSAKVADRPKAIVRSDISKAEPSESLTRDFNQNCWQLVDYETVDGIKGAMAWARPEDNCPVVILPLDAAGPHKIFIGINYTKSPYPALGQVDVKLTGDRGFRRIAAECNVTDEQGHPKFPEGQSLFKSIQEAYWKTADVTGQSLLFRQVQELDREPTKAALTNLAYVKLVPLEEHDRKQWEKNRPTSTTRRLAAIYCPGALSGSTSGTQTFHPTNDEWFADEFEPYKGSDIGLFIFDALRGNYCLYRSKIGDVGPVDNAWQPNWIDPLAAFTRLAHQDGMKIFASLRMIGPQYPMIRAPIARARHYWRMTKYSKRDRDGLPVSNLSLAYPEVRQHWLSLLRETLDYGIDDLQLHLNRSVPFVMFEEPVVREFKSKYDEDPRKLSQRDPRWIAHAASYLTQFVREVRKLLDEKSGRQLGVTVYGPIRDHPTDTVFNLKSYACDVETWLKEHLVDYVMPSQSIELDVLRRWRQIAGQSVYLWPDLMPRQQTPASYTKLAKKYFAAGADGFCLWDSESRHPRISEWAAVRQLGHVDEWDRLIGDSPTVYRAVELKMLGGFSVRESFRDG